MSKWYKPEDDDMAIDDQAKEVDIFLFMDYDGNNYVSLSFTQVKDLYERIFVSEHG